MCNVVKLWSEDCLCVHVRVCAHPCVVCSCMERNEADKLNTKCDKEGVGIITDLSFLYTFYILTFCSTSVFVL